MTLKTCSVWRCQLKLQLLRNLTVQFNTICMTDWGRALSPGNCNQASKETKRMRTTLRLSCAASSGYFMNDDHSQGGITEPAEREAGGSSATQSSDGWTFEKDGSQKSPSTPPTSVTSSETGWVWRSPLDCPNTDRTVNPDAQPSTGKANTIPQKLFLFVITVRCPQWMIHQPASQPTKLPSH